SDGGRPGDAAGSDRSAANSHLGQRRDRFAWSLSGPAASVPAAGDAATLAEAKEQLVEAMRAWSVWAGVRQADGGGPVAPRWVLLEDHHPDHPMSATTC